MNRDEYVSKHLIKTLAKVLIVSAWLVAFSCQKNTQGSTADAARAKELKQAEEFLQQVNTTARRIHSLEHRSNIHHLYHQLYEKKGDIRTALTNYKLSTELKDSLMGTKNMDEIQTMRRKLSKISKRPNN